MRVTKTIRRKIYQILLYLQFIWPLPWKNNFLAYSRAEGQLSKLKANRVTFYFYSDEFYLMTQFL
jgi:hypothetical protein